jgi:hypothetical protein
MFFIMFESAQLAPAREVNWDDLVHHIEQDIIDMPRGDELFMNSTTTRGSCSHAYRVLRVGRSPAGPYAMIGRIFGIDRSAVRRHFQKGTDRLNKVSPNERPLILSDEDLIKTITKADQMRRPRLIGEISYYGILQAEDAVISADDGEFYAQVQETFRFSGPYEFEHRLEFPLTNDISVEHIRSELIGPVSAHLSATYPDLTDSLAQD